MNELVTDKISAIQQAQEVGENYQDWGQSKSSKEGRGRAKPQRVVILKFLKGIF
jgi:hypothetical protein